MANGNVQQDPKEIYPKPPFDQGNQKFPGSEEDMNPQPDYGIETYQGCNKLTGMTALITGGDSGIGRAVAVAYAKEGADVVISYLNEEKDAKETVEAVESIGRSCLAIPGDIQSEAHCQSLVQQTIDKFGKMNILVNNAAFQQSHNSISEISSEEFDKVMKVNIYAMFYLSKMALSKIGEGGSIINTASIQAYQPSGSLIHYATTKGAIVTFTKALSEEALQKGIRVNAVAPGPIWTPLIPSSMPQEHVEQFGKSAPMERPGQPVEVAPIYVFLASKDASYITGQVYGVTGGKPLI